MENVAPRLVQLQYGEIRRVAVVEEPHLRLLADVDSIYTLANAAISAALPLTAFIQRSVTGERLDYDQIYSGRSAWRLGVPIDHPADPARCLVSGTGLTHLGSATDRNAMHRTSETERGRRGPQRGPHARQPRWGASGPRITQRAERSGALGPRECSEIPGGRGPRIKIDSQLTDSMRMFRSGLEGGRPEPGRCGASPEWFYKGTGTILRAPGEPLLVPSYAEDGGEEAEIAGVYVIDSAGCPRRIGMTAGNEFSDHKFERTNYLNLAGSKLRTCALGPELVINHDFHAVPGKVAIQRNGRILWGKDIATGESEMCHSLGNIEHHHFKFEAHRRPGDIHVHFYGAHSLSFGDGVQLADGDVMVIEFAGFGRALRNPLSIAPPDRVPIAVQPL